MRRNQNVESMEEVKDIIKNVLDESVNVTGFDLISRRIFAMQNIKAKASNEMKYIINDITDSIQREFEEWKYSDEADKGNFDFSKIEELVENNWRYESYIQYEAEIQIIELLAKTIKF